MKTLRFSILPALLLSAATLFAGACAEVTTDDTLVDDTATTSDEVAVRPSFDLWKDAAGAYRFQLLSAEGDTLLVSQSYSGRAVALAGLLSVLDNGGRSNNYLVRSDADGAQLDLLAANRAVIATSERFVEAAAAEAAIAGTVAAVAAYLEHWDTATGARFDVFEGADRRFFFNLHARNGAIVMSSQGYTTEHAALNGAFSVAENGVVKARYRVLQASGGRWYFNLTSSNGQIIATSQTYSSKYNAERARDSVVTLLPSIELLEFF